MRIEFGILGETYARLGAGRIDLGPTRQRSVLAVLLAETNAVVSVDQLTDRVWGAAPPHTAAKTLRSYLSRLRTALSGGECAIRSRSGGYVLEVDEAAVDVHLFRQIVGQARASRDDDAVASLYGRALQLWRGEAFADLDTPWAATMRRTLEDDRFLVRLDYHDVQLRQGRHTALLAELTALAAEHPLDERVIGQCMLALYRSGRQAEALEQYERTRRLLADKLGADPGTDLQELHRSILTGDLEERQARAEPVTPQELPSDIHGFVGRDADIAILDGLAAAAGEAVGASAPIVISAIDGAAGIGKTALAVHWAHRVKHRFPDGQLYLNLRGYGPGEPVRPASALAAMLGSVNVDPDRIPATVDERSALLRSKLAGRRMLIVLDNAEDSDQVRPLLPGSDALVLVTSRRKLRALSVRDGARTLTVNLLPEPEALRLLAEAIGTERVAGEPGAAAAIVRLCARLPLALRLAAERVNGQPGAALRDLVADLTDHRSRLAALSIEESADTDLRSVFAWSYDALEPEAARMFDLLGLHPGGSISVPAAAALAGVEPARAAATLEQLGAVNLVEQRFRGRFELHDLLREYAREQAEAHGGDHSAARGRLLQWYVHTAAHARAQLAATPHQLPLAPHPPEGITPERFGSHQAAVEWFDAEQDAIVKIVQSAGEHGHHLDGAILTQLIWPYFYLRGLWQPMRVVGEAGVEYAIAVGNPLLEAKIRNGLSTPYGYLPGFTEEEAATSERALSIFAGLGDRRGQADSLLNLGSTYHNAQRFAEARDALERARDLYLQEGNQLYAAFALNNLAGALRGLDRLDDALHCAHRAVDVIQGSAEPFQSVPALVTLAMVYAARHEHDEAIRCYREALSTAERLGSTYRAVPLRIELGHQLSAAGAEQDAVDVWREAYRICLVQEHPAAEEIERLVTSATERTNGTIGRP